MEGMIDRKLCLLSDSMDFFSRDLKIHSSELDLRVNKLKCLQCFFKKMPISKLKIYALHSVHFMIQKTSTKFYKFIILLSF